MRFLGNILWFLFGGLLGGLSWIFAGCIWCITIVGIPVGMQCFKFATLAFWPFGKDVVYGNGVFSFLINLIWIVFFGWEMALGNLIVGLLWCITIVGIPFGRQFFKLARLYPDAVWSQCGRVERKTSITLIINKMQSMFFVYRLKLSMFNCTIFAKMI